MVQFRVLNGSKAGSLWVARRFPVHIGRLASADLQLEEPGVWDHHLRLDFSPGEGFVLQAHEQARVLVNGKPFQQTLLHNGDAIDIGSLRLQFWLTENCQVGLRSRESLTWLIILGVSIVQVALMYWLLR